MPSRWPRPPGRLPGLSGLGRVSAAELAVLLVHLVADPLPAGCLRLLSPREPDRRPGRLPALRRAGPDAARAWQSPRPSRGAQARTATVIRQHGIPPPPTTRNRPHTSSTPTRASDTRRKQEERHVGK